MNRLLLGAVVLAALAAAGSAPAADMDVPAYRAPPPVAVFSWTGFYVGGDIGARQAVVDPSVTSATLTSAFGSVDLLAPAGCALVGCIGAGGPLDHTAFRAGLYAGANLQVAARWVVGIEGDWHYADRSQSTGGQFYPGASGLFVSAEPGTSFKVRTTWDASARARVGALIGPNTLIYATGGASWLHFEATSACPATSTVVAGLCDPAAGQYSPAVIAQSATKLGWTVGGGAEAMVWGNWLLRAEYRYANYGTWGSGTDNRASPVFPATTLAVAYSLKLQTHAAMFGLAYKFGGPVVANY